MKKRFSVGVAVLASSASIGLQAQEAENTMVVVGSRTPTQISQIPGAVWVIEQEEIQQQLDTGADLKTTLGRLVPGMDLAPPGRTNFGQNLRGRSVQVLIDGVSLNSSRGLSRQFDSIDPFNIERVEVLSGASSLYGGGATGGIVNIITRKGESGGPNWRTRASASSGFYDSNDFDKGLKQSISGGNDRVLGYLGVGYEDHGRFYGGAGDEILPDITQTDLQDNRTIDVLGNLNVQLTPEQDLQLTGQIYRSRDESDRGLYFPNLTDAPLGSLSEAEIRDGFNSDRTPATERKLINAQYHHGNLFDQDFYLQTFFREEEAQFNAFPGVPPRPLPLEGRFGVEWGASKQNIKTSGIKALFDADLTDSISLIYGVDYDHEEFDANQVFFDQAITDATGALVQQESRKEARYPSYEVDGLSGFLQGDWQATEALKLSAGVRQQHMKVDVDGFTNRSYSNTTGERVGIDVPGGDNDYDSTLFNASALYDFGDHQAWLRYSQGFELPNPAKYYGQANVAPNGDIIVTDVDSNPLSAIETDQVELGWRYRNDSWMGQAAVYYAWSDKAVEDNPDLSISVIDEKKRDYGFEGALTRYFDNGFETGGTLNLVRSEQKVDGSWDKRDVRTASVSSATAFLGWTDYERSVRLQANHNFDLEDDDDQEIDGYTTLDLAMTYQMGIGKLGLGIENLLDNSYTTVWSQRAVQFYTSPITPEDLFDYQGRGRTFTLSWSMDY